jgi:dipeptidyl aminopeptidase/acylaminoacyl peptidase
MAFDLDAFLASPRVSGLVLSPAGDRLVTSVATLSPDGTSFVSALWELDPAGQRAPRRLTRSAPGESSPAFLPDGGLLFTSKRPDPSVKETDDEVPALWLLPPGGGEARMVATTPAGVGSVAVARDRGTVVVASDAFPGSTSLADDRERAKARKDAKVNAVLFESYPFRYWDHDLGPREPRLFAAPSPAGDDDERVELRDLTPEPGRALDEASFALTPDGTTVVTTWQVGGVLDRTADLVAVDVADGSRRTLVHTDGAWYEAPACSPDGRWVVAVRADQGSPEQAQRVTLWLVELPGGEPRQLAADLDLWPSAPVWAPDSSAVYFCADEQGRAPVFRVDVTTGEVRRLSASGAFHDVNPSPDGRYVYALRALVDEPPHAVRLDAAATDQEPVVLPTPGHPLTVPSRSVEVVGTAGDGTPVHSWLVLPAEASAEQPAPLVVFIHGGPLSSWNDWHWRWCPHLLAERGYAVLLPDPALSTGYGQAFIERGWGRWGFEPYTDLLAAVDAAVARDDVDAERTAAMGGSFGGYMANWVAGHTTRFRCIVTHASLWALDQFHATTDDVAWLEYELGDPWVDDSRWRDNSPHLHVGEIRTPMLVTHGENDDRVPIGEALRLYTDLRRHGVESKFLLFPDENHWILKPNNSRLWYETVFAWLDHHLLGKDFTRPDLL